MEKREILREVDILTNELNELLKRLIDEEEILEERRETLSEKNHNIEYNEYMNIYTNTSYIDLYRDIINLEGIIFEEEESHKSTQKLTKETYAKIIYNNL